MKKGIARVLVSRTVTAAALIFTTCGGNKKEETTAAKQEPSVETKAGETTKTGESKMDEATKAGETKVDASRKDDRAANAKESTMVGTLDGIKDFTFMLIDEKGTTYQFTFERSKASEDLSDIKAGDKITVTYTGTVSETNPFEGMAISVKRA